MGTNYYHRTNLCDCCGRYDERHIGKSLSMFQGYRPDQWDTDTPVLLSWADWKAHLLAGGTVYDEYGQHVPVQDFIADVEAVPPNRRRRQTDWMNEHARTRQLADGSWSDWLDDEGYSFCAGDFF